MKARCSALSTEAAAKECPNGPESSGTSRAFARTSATRLLLDEPTQQPSEPTVGSETKDSF
jgi:hypothetical protein